MSSRRPPESSEGARVLVNKGPYDSSLMSALSLSGIIFIDEQITLDFDIKWNFLSTHDVTGWAEISPVGTTS